MISAGLVGCAKEVAPPVAPPVAPFEVTWKVSFNSMIFKGNWSGVIMEAWRDEIEERTNGAVKMELYWPGTLPYKGPDTLKAVSERLIDAAEDTSWMFGGLEPIFETKYATFLLENRAECKSANAMVILPHLLPKFDKHGIVVQIQAPSAGGGLHWFSQKPVTKLSDMKGVVRRAYSKATAEMVKAWGCVPVFHFSACC